MKIILSNPYIHMYIVGPYFFKLAQRPVDQRMTTESLEVIIIKGKQECSLNENFS